MTTVTASDPASVRALESPTPERAVLVNSSAASAVRTTSALSDAAELVTLPRYARFVILATVTPIATPYAPLPSVPTTSVASAKLDARLRA